MRRCYSAFVRCRAFEVLQEYFSVCLGNNGYLVFFKNDIRSGNILVIPFRIDRAEDKVFNLCALKENSHLLGVEI